jgi:hypothetical protein
MSINSVLSPVYPSLKAVKLVDQIYNCHLPGHAFETWNIQCHLQIFQTHPDIQTVIISDMPFELGWFIPFVVERLIEQIVNKFNLNPRRLVWIENYRPSFTHDMGTDFSQIIFEWEQDQAKNLKWVHISWDSLQQLIQDQSSGLTGSENQKFPIPLQGYQDRS